LRECICQCWNCAFKETCGVRAFEKCLLKSGDFREIPNAFTLYDDAIKSTNKKIQTIFETEDVHKIIGGLLFRREEQILHCFYEAPGDLPSAISTANSFINRDLSTIGHEDVKDSDLAEEIWNLIVTREMFSNQSSRLKNGDILCFGNQQGKEELTGLVNNPLHIIEQLKSFVEKKTPPTIEGQNVKLVYSGKMLPVIEWCMVNVHQADLWDYTLDDNFSKILKHLEKVGTTGEISPRICYKLAYPHYAGLLHTCRYVYSKFQHIKNIAQLNKGIDQTLRTKYSISFDVERGYDSFLFNLWTVAKSGKMCTTEAIGKDSQDYRFLIQDGALFGSVLLFGFMSKNYESICLKPYERGRIFEDFVEKELLDRQVKILKKNFETPEGEVDFVCSKNDKIFLVEAKDYGPWFDDSYVGSKTYLERVESISGRLEKAPPRLQWIESHPSEIGLATPQKIRGVVLTRFFEPHIRIPMKFQHITIDEMDKIFGQSEYQKVYETNLKFRFTKEERSRLERELPNKVSESIEYGLV
jgi:hypothetical protein